MPDSPEPPGLEASCTPSMDRSYRRLALVNWAVREERASDKKLGVIAQPLFVSDSVRLACYLISLTGCFCAARAVYYCS